MRGRDENEFKGTFRGESSRDLKGMEIWRKSRGKYREKSKWKSRGKSRWTSRGKSRENQIGNLEGSLEG